MDAASQEDARGHAQHTTDAGSDCAGEGQAQGGCAWQAKATADGASQTAQNTASEAAQPLPTERLAAQAPMGAPGEALPSSLLCMPAITFILSDEANENDHTLQSLVANCA